jgi:hypothetical protein
MENLMANEIQGVDSQEFEGYVVCHINEFSESLKELIRGNLAVICHGSHVCEYFDDPMYNYKSTIKSFLERYVRKTKNTQIGMIGELLSHVLITSLYDDYDVASAFFNLEEKSIKKGFDLVLYNKNKSNVWITEVKSGNIHKNKDYDQTTTDLLGEASRDLNKRLNEQETQYWMNAINHVRSSLGAEKDYKDVLLKILREDYGRGAAQEAATSKDKNIFLVTNLFESLDIKISENPAKHAFEKVSKSGSFLDVVVLTIQKATFDSVANFLEEELK